MASCGGPQSALDPAGRDAAQLYGLFVVMVVGAVVIWTALMGLFVYVTRIRIGHLSRRWAEGVIIGGGIVFPLVALIALLSYALPMMPEQRADTDGLTLRVKGEQWWWRVEYWPEGADAPIVASNEVRFPARSRSVVELTSERVIHSFWVPVLAGKMDMFPGRVTRMSVEPTKPGVYRGQCTEFCGLSHALMAFSAVVMEPGEFEDWLAAQAEGVEGEGGRGLEIFLSEGCGACHAIRGTPARGNVGPDLTHVGGRELLAAGILPMEVGAMMRWIAAPDTVKPGAEMPDYDHMSEADLRTLAEYLVGLE